MKILSSLFLCISLILLSGCLGKENQESAVISNIEISNAYAFATMPGAETGGAFMTIHNNGEDEDKLIAVKSNIAAISEIHQNVIDPDDGMMMMRKANEVIIPAKGSVELEPQGYHVMLIKLNEPLTLGSATSLSLTFEKAGTIETNIEVVQPGAASPSMSHHGH